MMKLYNVVMVLLLSSIRVTSKESPSASRNHTLLYTNSSIGDAKHSKPKSPLPVQPGKEEVKSKGARFSGDLIIGGLFPVHKKALNGCGEIQPDRGLQRVEAMLFTIDHINRNKDILPDVTLGVNILDTCSRETYALDQALEYVRASVNRFDPDHFRCDDKSNPILVSAPENVVAVVGGSYSSVSIQVANLLRLFKIPQVSYASTSAALSDKTRFELFARTVPPDNYQAKAMADIVQYFNWSYVNTVASEGDYGEMGIDSFRQESRARNVCLAVSEKVSQSATPERFDEIIRRLMTKPTSRVVVLFLRVEDAKEILQAARRQNVSGHFVWVASDGWGKEEMPIKGNDLFGEGAITIELQSSHIHDFDVYFKKLNPIENLRNPWFIEYWEHIHECIFEDSAILRHLNLYPHSQHRLQQQKSTVRRCTGREVLSPKHYTQESKMQFVFDAVYSLAHALHRMFEDNCGRVRGRKAKLKCIRTLKIDGEVLYRTYLLNISFDDGYGANVKFDRFGDGIGRYNIMNYRRNRATRKFEYVNIGRWNSGLIMNSNERVTWTGGTYDVPISQCSRPCETGQIKHVQQGDACCWVCTSCDPSEIVQDEYTCEQCESGWWPSPDKDRCVQLEVQYMQWESPYALVPVGLSITGIIFTCMVIVTFIRKIETPIVKASGRELSFMLFAGFLICYLLTFVLLAKPSPVICGIQRFGVGFGFAVTYSSLLTKTNRISRIFDSARHSAKRPAFISPQSQVVIALMLISVQVIGAIVWLVLDPPHVRLYHPFERRDEIVLKCGLQDQWFMLSLIYNMFLILVCTLYAIKTRKIPENFNESKYIGFAMYTTCIIWLAFVPIYFGTLNSFQVQITTLCISISLSATVALVCLFVPKLHVIWFQSEKNVRKLTMKPSFNYKKSTSSNVITTDLGFGGRPSNTSATVVAGTSSIVSAGCHTRFSTPTVTEMERSGVQMEEDFMLNCQSSLLTAHRIQPATDDDGIERLEADMDNIALRERHDCIASIDTVYKL